jgi:hypothetical protein
MSNNDRGQFKNDPNDGGESPSRIGDDRDRADRPTGHASLPDADTAENRNDGRIGLGRRLGRVEGADADSGVLLTDGGPTQSPESRLREALKKVQIAQGNLPSEINPSGITTTLNRIEVNIRGVADALEKRSSRERAGGSQTIAGPGDETEPITDGGRDRECSECERLLIYRGECAGCGWIEGEAAEEQPVTDGGAVTDEDRIRADGETQGAVKRAESTRGDES